MDGFSRAFEAHHRLMSARIVGEYSPQEGPDVGDLDRAQRIRQIFDEQFRILKSSPSGIGTFTEDSSHLEAQDRALVDEYSVFHNPTVVGPHEAHEAVADIFWKNDDTSHVGAKHSRFVTRFDERSNRRDQVGDFGHIQRGTEPHRHESRRLLVNGYHEVERLPGVMVEGKKM